MKSVVVSMLVTACCVIPLAFVLAQKGSIQIQTQGMKDPRLICDGQKIVASTLSGGLLIDRRTGSTIFTFEGDGSGAEYSRNADTVAFLDNMLLKVIRRSTNEEIYTYNEISGTGFRFLGDDRILLIRPDTSLEFSYVDIISLKTKKRTKSIRLQKEYEFFDNCEVSPDGKYLAMSSFEFGDTENKKETDLINDKALLSILNLENGKIVWSKSIDGIGAIPFGVSANRPVFSRDRKRIAFPEFLVFFEFQKNPRNQ